MAIVRLSHVIVVVDVPSNDPNVPFTWSTGFDSPPIGDGSSVNTGPNDLLDIGDQYGSVNAPFSGCMIEFGGQTYAIFSNDTVAYIPYKKVDGDLARLTNGAVRQVSCPTMPKSSTALRPER